MYIKNGIYREVSAASLTAPISAGTVVTVNGNIAAEDGHDAYGIVPENINNISPTGRIYVCVGGTIDLHSPANAGITFSDAVIAALGKDINFVPAAETAPPELPSLDEATAGDVLKVNESGDGVEWGEAGGSAPVVLDLTVFDDLTATGATSYVEITAPTADLSVVSGTTPSFVLAPTVTYNVLEETYALDTTWPIMVLVSIVDSETGDVYVDPFPVSGASGTTYMGLNITNGGD